MELEKLLNIGRELGYEGEQLRRYVDKQQAIEREERAQRRQQDFELQKMRMEAEQAEKERERQETRERQREQVEREREERERQERREREQAEREERQADREMEMRRAELQLQARRQQEAGDGTQSHGTVTRIARPTLKLPKFEDGKDDMDAFLDRFERVMEGQGVRKDDWNLYLSTLLSGKGLEVYTSMSASTDEQDSYQGLRDALLRRYELTEDGFRRKFRESKVERGETMFQFVSRLERYLNRWTEMANTDATAKDIKDLLIREQFMNVCTPTMALFLRERSPKSLKEMTTLAEQYIEAHGCSNVPAKPLRREGLEAPIAEMTATRNTRVGERDSSRRPMPPQYRTPECFKCHRRGHLARDCRNMQVPHRMAYLKEGYEKQVDYRVNPVDQGRTSRSTCSQQIDRVIAQDVDMSNMPVRTGYVSGQRVKVLRDTGCSSVVIKKSLVNAASVKKDEKQCVLIDGTVRSYPTADVSIDTPFYTGKVEALCVDSPIYELIVGNIPGVKDAVEEDWYPRESFEVAAVATRARGRKGDHCEPLKVPEVKFTSVNSNDLKKMQQSDDSLCKLWDRAREENPKADDKDFEKGRGAYFVSRKNGLLYRRYNDHEGRLTEQVVVPVRLRSKVLRVAHESIVSGHLGIKKTTERICSTFFWPGITGDVVRFCKSCDLCQRTAPKGRTTKVPLGSLPLMEAPFERIAVDLIGPIQPSSDRGHRYILTVVDYATRYPEAIALHGIETTRVAEALFSTFCRVGFPKEILSDRGTQFTSGLMEEVARLASIKQYFTSPYHPQCNGLCERVNGVLKSMLRKMCLEQPRDWDRYLPAVLFAYREVTQSSTGFSPFELLYGRSVRGPMQALEELWTGGAEPEKRVTYEYVVDLRNRLEETCKLAQENLVQAQRKYKHHYDKKTRPRKFEVGEQVLVLLPLENNKFLLQWKGPYEVVARVGALDYKVQEGTKVKIYHVNLLKRYHQRENSECPKQLGSAVIVHEGVDEMDSVTRLPEDNDILDLNPSPKETDSTPRDVTVSEHLSSPQKEEVQDLLHKYQDIFTENPGHTTLVEHCIETVVSEPVRVKPYEMPYAVREQVSSEIHNMLELGVIEPSQSNYCAPIVLIRKKDGSMRFCVDFRKLNTITKFDSEPMQDPDAITSKLSGDRYFTKIDLSKGFWQIAMEGKSKHMTAFVTPEGCYQFTRMPFGLVNSTATFNRMMRRLLSGVPNTEHYVDDILIHSKTWMDHMSTLKTVFDKLRDQGLTVKPNKCMIGFEEVEFVGHVVGKGEMAMGEEKTSEIQRAARPKTKKQVRSFLGLASYYRRFIPNFAQVSAPLSNLTKKGLPNTVNWTTIEERSFNVLKDLLSRAPVLQLPDLKKDFSVQVDASDSGIGAVLLQEHDEILKPVYYASRKLLPRECKYSVTERECLAIVFAIKKFEKYLYGKTFTVQTDHQPLVYIQKAKLESARVMRWALFLQQYRFRIEAIRGTDNVGADYLSRIH